MLSLILTLTLALCATSTISQICCEWGEFFKNDNNMCSFNCTEGFDAGTKVEISDLMLNDIKTNCHGLQDTITFKPSTCNTLTNFIWPETYCGCPSCQCNNENKEGEYIETTQTYSFGSHTYSYKECGLCKCEENSDGILVYECEYISTSSPSNYDQFSCPSTRCIDYKGDAYLAGNGWFNQTDSCNQYCFCNYDSTIECIQGFENILQSSNDNLVSEFMNECVDELRDCVDNGTRMIVNGDYSNCGCPTCDCGTYSIDDTWWISYTNTWDEENIMSNKECEQCKCKENPKGNIKSNTECGLESYSYFDDDAECPDPFKQYNCRQDYSDSPIVGSLQTEIGYMEVNDYCGWWYSASSYLRPYSWGATWGIWNILDCDAFGGINECVHYVTYNDDGSIDDDEYHYCCQGDYCNDMDIDISICKDNQDFANWFDNFNECRENAH
eukprot:75364_1